MGDAEEYDEAGLVDPADDLAVDGDRGGGDPLEDCTHGQRIGSRPMGDLLITVAPTGAETTKADCPQLPTTLEELVETARRCEAAGAAMVHVHIRDAEHRPTLDQGRLNDDRAGAA